MLLDEIAPSIEMVPSLIPLSRNVPAAERALKTGATDGSNKKGVQPNDQGLGQHLDRMFHAEFPRMWLDARAKMLKIFNSLKLFYITPDRPSS